MNLREAEDGIGGVDPEFDYIPPLTPKIVALWDETFWQDQALLLHPDPRHLAVSAKTLPPRQPPWVPPVRYEAPRPPTSSRPPLSRPERPLKPGDNFWINDPATGVEGPYRCAKFQEPGEAVCINGDTVLEGAIVFFSDVTGRPSAADAEICFVERPAA